MKTNWDYTDRAHTYDKRADYSGEAIQSLIEKINCPKASSVADIGAGTGKLTKLLSLYYSKIYAVEPNDNMRSYGINNTLNMPVIWSEGVGESTGLDGSSVDACFFGSSFNVLNQAKTLQEVSRILTSKGWFVCMWNHRDIEDSVQKQIELIISNELPLYDYGSRRNDPSPIINSSGLFGEVFSVNHKFDVIMEKKQIIDAWKSHDTLYRQSEGKFDKIISQIDRALTKNQYSIPYYTRIWCSQLRS